MKHTNKANLVLFDIFIYCGLFCIEIDQFVERFLTSRTEVGVGIAAHTAVERWTIDTFKTVACTFIYT